MTGPFGWVLGLVGIVVLAASLFQLQRDWFDVGKTPKPRLSTQVRRLYIAGIFAGLGLFVVSMIVGPHR